MKILLCLTDTSESKYYSAIHEYFRCFVIVILNNISELFQILNLIAFCFCVDCWKYVWLIILLKVLSMAKPEAPGKKYLGFGLVIVVLSRIHDAINLHESFWIINYKTAPKASVINLRISHASACVQFSFRCRHGEKIDFCFICPQHTIIIIFGKVYLLQWSFASKSVVICWCYKLFLAASAL